MVLSLIDLFAEAVLRWSLRCDRPAEELTELVLHAVHSGASPVVHACEVEEMRRALHQLTRQPGLREDFLVHALVRELDELLEDQLENFGRGKAQARTQARQLELALRTPIQRARYLGAHGISLREAEARLAELRHQADPVGGIEELARRKRALDAWRDLAAPVVAPEILREWRAERVSLRGEAALGE